MKKISIFSAIMFALACTKSESIQLASNDTTPGPVAFQAGDTLTYEVLTSDPGGWFGIWADSTGNITGTPLSNITYGSPVYSNSGWKYSFTWNGYESQLMMSAAAKSYAENITINLYRNNELIRTVTNGQMTGVAKTLYNIPGDSLNGTANKPLLTYEVTLDEMDSSKFAYDGWNGNWHLADNNVNTLTNVLTDEVVLAIPSGWRYNFTPQSLPFTMNMQAFPYTSNACRVNIHFYVNRQLVKTYSSRDMPYPPVTYEVL